MDEADKGQSKLTAEEKHRNKRIGDINLYFVKSETSPLTQVALKEGQKFDANFLSLDHLSGQVTGNNTLHLGKKIEKIIDGEKTVVVESNKAVMHLYEHPAYESHYCRLLD